MEGRHTRRRRTPRASASGATAARRCLPPRASPLPVAEYDDAGHRPRPPHIVRQAECRVLHLAAPCLAAQLRDTLVDHAHTTRPDRMAERLEAAARVDRDVAAEGRASLLHQLAAFALLAETEILGVGYLGPCEAVVYLGEVDVRRRDAGHRVRLPGGRLRRAEAEIIEGRIEVRPSGGDRQADALHADAGLAEALGQVGATEDRGGGAVGRRAAVEETERPGDDGDRKSTRLNSSHLGISY